MQQWHKSRSFVEACQFAWAGIREIYRQEHNLRRQSWIFLAAVVLGFSLNIPVGQLALVILAGGFVLSMEFINSALEQVQDLVWPEYHQTIKRSKDIAAGAVLVSSLTAAAVGLLIFIPPLANLFRLLY